MEALTESDKRDEAWSPAPAPEKPSLEDELEEEEDNVYSILEPGTEENEKWNPGALDFDSWDDRLEEDAEHVEEKYDLEVRQNFEEASFFPHPGNAKASTQTRTYLDRFHGAGVENVLGYDPLAYSFDSAEEIEKTILHENFHAEASKARVFDTLEEEMDEDAAEYLAENMRYGDLPQKEGATEFSALYTHENGQELAGNSYPLETAEVSRQLYQQGIHPDTGLAAALEGEVDQVMEMLGFEKKEGGSYHEDGIDAYSPENVPGYLKENSYEGEEYFGREEGAAVEGVVEEEDGGLDAPALEF